MGMKRFKQWGSTTSSNLRSHVLISTCHSVSDMSITIVLNFFYIYLYILCTKSVFLSWIKRVFEDVSLSTNPILAVCLRVQQKSVWCLYSPCFYLSHSVSSCSRRSPTHPGSFPRVFEKGEGGRVISSVYSVVSQRHQSCPGLPWPCLPTHEEWAPEWEKADQEVRFCVVAEGEVGLVSHLQGRAPPPLLLLIRPQTEERESTMRI